ncbi:MAG: hypothetical protein GY849_00310, partial [Deltaproteobacteria bacterium]|nr:hypothetical protein [Deltaproteobacteria bacterium]
MNRNLHKFDPLETALYISLALIPVILVFYLFYFKPVLFTQMVMEDHWGEYGTAVSYALAGFLMISLAFRRGPCLRRTVWAIIGLLAVFIAGEEISWGQRIFRFSLPMFFRQASTLNELNLHNIETLGFLESAAA